MKATLSLILCFVLGLAFAQDAEPVKEGHDPESLIKEGIRLHDAGEYDKAIEKYLAAISLDPKNATAYYEAAFSYSSKRDHENSLKMAEKAIEFGNSDTRRLAIVSKGSTLDEMGRRKESAEFYEKGLKEFPDFYLLWFNYGVTLAALKRFDDAENAYIKGLNIRISHPGSNLQLGNLNKMLNRKASAALCYYFFLLLENNSNRSKDAANSLLELMYPKTDSTQNVFTINIGATAIDAKNPMAPAELFLGLMSVDRDKSKSNQQRFVEDTDKFLGMLSELKENQAKAASSKKKKKKNDSEPNFYFDTYVPFFSDLRAADHLETFCYHIMKSTGDPEVTKWLADNKDKVDRFYTWLKTR
ncbi:MAG: tetratricopeptide repeat protein [Bacteroidota bacterium]